MCGIVDSSEEMEDTMIRPPDTAQAMQKRVRRRAMFERQYAELAHTDEQINYLFAFEEMRLYAEIEDVPELALSDLFSRAV